MREITPEEKIADLKQCVADLFKALEQERAGSARQTCLHISAHNHLMFPLAFKEDHGDVVISGIIRLQKQNQALRNEIAELKKQTGKDVAES